MNYYNEKDPFVAQWLRNLIEAKLIPAGYIDERDIRDVTAADVNGFNQVHLFAGIGGWPLALHLANVDPSFSIWTGSCPCQPYSVAGKKLGHDDDRNLWPEMSRLINQRRPSVVFGEQVAGAIGREWLARVYSDLEDLGYAVGAADLCAAGAGAPQIRQRLFWVADTYGERCKTKKGPSSENNTESFWASSCATIQSNDGRQRRIESGIFPLVNGIPNRVGRLRAYGNSIVPQVGAKFIEAWLSCRS